MHLRRHAAFSRTITTLIVYAWMALFSAIHISQSAVADEDEVAHGIRALIGKTWDKPDSKVVIDPVVISGDYAVASWTQGDQGGRALLRRTGAAWSVVLCSGDPLRQAKWLQEAGVPQSNSEQLARDLAAAEALVPQKRRAVLTFRRCRGGRQRCSTRPERART